MQGMIFPPESSVLTVRCQFLPCTCMSPKMEATTCSEDQGDRSMLWSQPRRLACNSRCIGSSLHFLRRAVLLRAIPCWAVGQAGTGGVGGGRGAGSCFSSVLSSKSARLPALSRADCCERDSASSVSCGVEQRCSAVFAQLASCFPSEKALTSEPPDALLCPGAGPMQQAELTCSESSGGGGQALQRWAGAAKIGWLKHHWQVFVRHTAQGRGQLSVGTG